MKHYGIAIGLNFFFGGIGVHKFYLNRPGKGILYALFFWTGIPLILSIIELVIMLINGKAAFDNKYNSRSIN